MGDILVLLEGGGEVCHAQGKEDDQRGRHVTRTLPTLLKAHGDRWERVKRPRKTVINQVHGDSTHLTHTLGPGSLDGGAQAHADRRADIIDSRRLDRRARHRAIVVNQLFHFNDHLVGGLVSLLTYCCQVLLNSWVVVLIVNTSLFSFSTRFCWRCKFGVGRAAPALSRHTSQSTQADNHWTTSRQNVY